MTIVEYHPQLIERRRAGAGWHFDFLERYG